MFFYNVIDQILTVYVYIVIIRAIMSWFVRNPYNPVYRVVIGLTEPVLSFIRKMLPNMGGIDISPIILIIFIEWFVKGILLKNLFFGTFFLGYGG